MMKARPIFVDSGAWLALVAPDDQHHRQAKQALPKILRRYPQLISSNLVLAEAYSLIQRVAGKARALSFLDFVHESPRVKIVYSDREVENRAIDLVKKFGDQTFSYTDAVSFVLMQSMDLVEAFGFDIHFKVAGFVRIPADKAP